MKRIYNYQIWSPDGQLHCEYYFANFTLAYAKFQLMYSENLLKYRHKIISIPLDETENEIYPDTVLYVFNHE